MKGASNLPTNILGCSIDFVSDITLPDTTPLYPRLRAYLLNAHRPPSSCYIQHTGIRALPGKTRANNQGIPAFMFLSFSLGYGVDGSNSNAGHCAL